ncbi:hypothetical protein HXY33_05645 [Candidatus Bathyarchaeota archaeon]|nr:hypothetical protein [Candidatus Bathyarchaeota archaeon]
MKKCGKTSLTVIALVTLSILISNANAATITSCTLDRQIYNQGETGCISVTVYNDKDAKIRVYEITATINYFYADGTTYMQTFFTNATLPIEIPQGESQTFHIPFTLPTNIAPGYARFLVRAKTEIWNEAAQRWYQSENPTTEIFPYIESPYKQEFEQQQAINEQLQNQINEQEDTINQLQNQLKNLQASYNNMTLLVYIIVTITIVLGITMAFTMKMVTKPRATPQPPQ